MKCSRAMILLNLYVDGRLPLRRFAALEDHLRECAACSEELCHLELVARALVESPLAAEPEGLTALILARIAGFEVNRARSGERAFAPRWGDAVLAAVLASLTTLLFVFLDPHLRPGILSGLATLGGHLSSVAAASGTGASALLVWTVWIAAGCVLTLWLAGAQLRSTWRRSLAQHIPQLRQPG